MVNAPNPLGVHSPSISYVYILFQCLDMPWMGIWVCPYTVTPVKVRGGFQETDLSPGPSDVVMSWLRLQTHFQTRLECITHPCHMYTKCFSTWICRGWAYGCTRTLLRLFRPGVEFRKIGVGQSLSDVVISWLRLQTPNLLEVHPSSMSYVYTHSVLSP